MILLPAIDLYEGRVVRLYQGDYDKMTVYSADPLSVARAFESAGAEHVHVVDLAGARDGATPDFDTVAAVAAGTKLQVEIGGGVRSEETVRQYLAAGVARVILGTAAITDPALFRSLAEKYPGRIAAGVDVRDGFIAIRGWIEQSAMTLDAFMEKFQQVGVKTVICTDISRDGAMRGTNREMYAALQDKYAMDIIASGGVSMLEDVRALRAMGLYGAIVGKACYTGAIDIREAIEVAR